MLKNGAYIYLALARNILLNMNVVIGPKGTFNDLMKRLFTRAIERRGLCFSIAFSSGCIDNNTNVHLLGAPDVHPERNIDTANQNIRNRQRYHVVVGQNTKTLVCCEGRAHQRVSENRERTD